MRLRFLLPFLFCGILAAQTFTPRSITFTGAPAYSSAELLKMSGLTPGQAMTQAEIEAALHKLDDTGLFSNINYKLENGALRIVLEPMGKEQTRTIVYTNFVLDTPAELNAALQAKLPLFNGSVPVNGEMQAGVERALEAYLEEKHQVHATVTSLGDGSDHLNYSIASPQVLVGKVMVVGADLEAEKNLQAVRDRVQGSEYLAGTSGDALTTNLGDAYQDLGYVDFTMSAVTHGAPVVTAKTITVDLLATAQPGALYHTDRVDLPVGVDGVAPAELERDAQLKVGAPASRIERLSTVSRLNDSFTRRGYLEAVTSVQQARNEKAHTVTYSFQTVPGARYRMRNFIATGFSPDRAQLLAGQWTLAPGVFFDGTALDNFVRSAAVKGCLSQAAGAAACACPRDPPGGCDCGLPMRRNDGYEEECK